MALYLVSYDIAEKDSFEYQGLWDKLEELGAVKILYSEWVIARDAGSAEELYYEIAPCTQSKDRLLVQEMTKDAKFDKLLVSDPKFKVLLKKARG